MNDKIVSVIIPVYKVEKYLQICLDSVIKQTYQNLEILCVNDASPDNSLAVLHEYADKDDRIKILNNVCNRGLATSRNIALEVAKGDYVMFLDSDDWLEQVTIEKCVESIERTQADFIAFGLVQYIEELNENKRPESLSSQELAICQPINAYMFARVGVTACTKFFNKSFLVNHQIKFPDGRLFEDNPFSWICCVCAKKVTLLPDCFYHYRKRQGSITMSAQCNDFVRNLDLIEVLQYFYEYLQRYNYWESQKQNFSICVDSLMSTALRNVVPLPQHSEFIQQFQTRALEWDWEPLKWSLTYDLIHKGRVGSWNLYRWVKSIRKRVVNFQAGGGFEPLMSIPKKFSIKCFGQFNHPHDQKAYSPATQ